MTIRKRTKGQTRSTKHTHKTKDRVTWTPLKKGGELRCSGMEALPTPLVAGLSKFNRQFLFYFHAVSPCNSLTCENDGSCVVNNGVANCYCYGDFSGSNCEGKVHELDVDISVKCMS
jgi:hypothetical protein